MAVSKVTMSVRPVDATTSIIDIQGEVSAFAEETLTEAYRKASRPGVRTILLNCNRLEYMNSGGIGLLVTLLVRVNRQKQRLLTYGLSEHYQHIFRLTRLSEVIGIYETEEEALASCAPAA